MTGRDDADVDRIVSITIKIPRSLLSRIERVADERVVGRNRLIERALVEFLSALRPLDEVRLSNLAPPAPHDGRTHER